jgi:tetratricopeptide (TPR) repeat protein
VGHAPGGAAAAAAPPGVGLPAFKNIWPIPTLTAGGLLLVAGLAVAFAGRPRAPSDLPLEEAKALVQEKRYQEAIDKLASKEVLQYIDFGNPDDAHMRAFYLARARAFAGAQATLGLNRIENDRIIVQDYEHAESLGEGGGTAGAGERSDGQGGASAHPQAGEHARGGAGKGEERGGGGRALDPSDVSILVESLIALDEIEGDSDSGAPGALKRIGALPESESARKMRLTREVVNHDLAIIVAGATSKKKRMTEGGASEPGFITGEVAPGAEGGGSRGGVGLSRRTDRTLDLLGRLAADPGLSSADKAWVLARQAELLLAAGQADEAINKLIRRVGLLKDVPRERQGELYVLLGRAYFQADQPLNAMKQLDAADSLLEKSSPLRADLGILQARLAQSGVAVGAVGSAENDPTALLEFAREKFESVMREFGQASGGKPYARALLGAAEVEAALRHDDRSLEHYAELVARVTGRWKDSALERSQAAESAAAPKDRGQSGRPRDLGEVTRDRVLTSLMQRYHERFDSGQVESALRYADIAETLFKEEQTPPEVLLAIGTARRKLGDQLLAQAREARMHAAASAGASPGGRDFTVADLDATTRAEVRRNYILAGDYLRRHARAAAGTDLAASSKSLWTAADSYDRAGDLDEAKKAFADYAQEASDTDPHKAEAKFRLAQVFRAKNPPELGAAAALYRDLLNSVSGNDPTRNAGTWGDAAIVPLAQCLLADSDPSNDEEAQRLLEGVVNGSRGVSPESEAYREALIELGQSNYRAERFAKAIEWLEQAVKRYKDDAASSEGARGAERMESVRYLLADSHRREGVEIGKTLSTQKLPQSDVEALQAARVEHLTTARMLYDAVRAELEAKEASGKTLGGMEAIELRNSYFYEGDCAMELRAYDAAIAAYDAARNKYADDPSSLVAMAQIVSAYAAEGKWAEARTANERARQQLAKFPDSVWQNPDLPMEKRHWEKWLEARTLIGQRESQEGDARGKGRKITGGDDEAR